MHSEASVNRNTMWKQHLSHELRTPLTVARGYAELVQRHLNRPDPDVRRLTEMNERMLAQLLRLEAVIRHSLDDE